MAERDRFGLTPELRTFAFVDLVLVLTCLLLFAVLQPWRADGPVPSTGASSASSSAVAPETSPDPSPSPATDTGTLRTFVLPSKNIWCQMDASSATCTILSFTYTPPATPEGCAGAVGNVMRIVAGKQAELVCVVGSPPAVPADAPTLDYGQASAVGEMTCHSSKNGVTCLHNATGRGFAVARAGYLLF